MAFVTVLSGPYLLILCLENKSRLPEVSIRVLFPFKSQCIIPDTKPEMIFKLRKKKMQPFSGIFVTGIFIYCLNMMPLKHFFIVLLIQVPKGKN